MSKKLSRSIKQLIQDQIEVEGFDYAMTEKISPDDWEAGSLPDDIKQSWDKYMAARNGFKGKLREYGIDPQ